MKTKLITIFSCLISVYSIAQWGGTNPHTLNDNAYVNGNMGVGTNAMAAKLNIQHSQFGLPFQGAPITSYTTGIRFTHRYKPWSGSPWTNYVWDVAVDSRRFLIRHNNNTSAYLAIGNTGNTSIGTYIQNDRLNVLGFTRMVHNTTNYLRAGVDASNSHIDYRGSGKLLINMTYKQPAQFGGEVQACLVRTSEVVVESGWCDYVFEEEYPLMSIDEMKSYIQKHKHLPNVTPAVDVESNGLEMADMQRRMMEKIEELSLYVIQLNDQNKEQQQTIEELKNTIDSLTENK